MAETSRATGKFSRGAYLAIRKLVEIIYPKTAVVGRENLPDEACIIVGNHAQMNGPIIGELYCPGNHYVWCAGQMMELKEVPAYAYTDFWCHKPKWISWFYKLLSYIIAPISVCIFNNAHTVPVYRDARVLTTFRRTIERLNEGAHIVIFPEHAVPHNNIVNDFQDRFIDTARMYFRRTGKDLCFVPMYVAPALKSIYLGKPIRFDHGTPIDQERERICSYLMEEITAIGRSLPLHRVVPYDNISKKLYPMNKIEVI